MFKNTLFQWQALSAPAIPQVRIIPSYSSDSRELERLFITTMETKVNTEDLFYISGDISGIPISNHNTAGASLNDSFNSTFKLSSCEEDNGCSIELPSSFHCHQSTIINVSISAANKPGEGLHSNPFIVECTNNFVQVVYKENSAESVVSCIFQNQSEDSWKTCCITYQTCDQKGPQKFQECNGDVHHEIQLDVFELVMPDQVYCYTVIASNTTHSVNIKGRFSAGLDHQENTNKATTAIVISCSLVFLFVACTAVLIICSKCSRTTSDVADNLLELQPINITDERYLTEYSLPSRFKRHKVRSDRKLRQYVTMTVNEEFKRGHTYYEFTNDLENILEGKEVLLQKKKNKKWFKLAQPEEITARDKKFYGEDITRASFGNQYRVFIQSFGSGTRHLPGGSKILYNHDSDQVQPDSLPLVPICSEYFIHKAIDSDRPCIEFCTQNGLNTNAFNIFLTVEHLPEDMRGQPPRDVILMDRRSKVLFTGPKARQLVLDSKSGGESQWKVFALLQRRKQGLVLKTGSEVLYQDPRYKTGKYAVVEVDEDCVRMSKFIEAKLKCQFEDGKAFYEATEREENFLYFKKILRPEKEKLSRKQLELQSLVEYFYAIDGVPANGVKLDDLRHMKIFIQSTSQGSRCLKKGDKLLYLKEYIISQVDPDEANHASPGSVFLEDEHHHIQEQK